MDEARDRLSLVAHAALPMLGPLTVGELDALLDEADLDAGARVLDLGCGRGDVGLRCAKLLARLSGSTRGAIVTLVDRSPVFLAEASARSRGLGAIDLVEEDVGAYLDGEVENVALAVCLGATYALGGIEQAARRMEETLRKDGAILVGDLVALGARAESAFEIPLLDDVRPPGSIRRRVIVPPDAMARYESTWTDAIRAHLAAHPDDPAAQWARERIAWMDALGAARTELAYAAWLLGA